MEQKVYPYFADVLKSGAASRRDAGKGHQINGTKIALLKQTINRERINV